jgi:3-hydroxybutyryl-CoA dehydrogenase
MKKVAIVGAGVMGAGIALSSVLGGYETTVYDINLNTLEQSKEYIKKQLNISLSKQKINEEQMNSAWALLKFTETFEEVRANLIIEAIVEKLEVKQQLFQKLEIQNDLTTIFASNTSSIPITQIASVLVNPERLVGIHFFNPAHLMKLIEIIKGASTNDEVAKTAYTWALSIGKTPVYAKDSPGFIVNRVARHFYVESLKILEENTTDIETIDSLVESMGFKMGPFKLMDLIGVETNYSVTNSMFEQFNFDPKFRPNRIQKQKVDAGFFGKKTGKGFYTYD